MRIKEIEPAFQTWIDERPEPVREVMKKYHPYASYRMAPTDQLCVIASVFEDGKVSVVVFDELLMTFSHRVSGVDPVNLTECDITDEIKKIMLASATPS